MAVHKRESLVSTIFYTVRYIGLWQEDKRNRKQVFAKVSIFCYLSSYALQLIELVMSKSEPDRLFECFSVISFCGMGILKLFSLGKRCEVWLRLLDKMAQLEAELQRDKKSSIVEYQSDDEEERSQVPGFTKKYTDKFMSTSTLLFRIYCFTGVIFILSPFIEYSFRFMQGTDLEMYPHILPIWKPWDGAHFSCYVVTVICEAVAAIYCVCVHIAFDSTVIGVMIFICGNFSTLIYQSERIAGKGKICVLSKKRDTRAHFRIIKCHRVHIQLVSLINELDGLLKNILGFYFFLATLTLCVVAVRLKTEQMGVMQLVPLLQYMCATLTQLYIYCSYGDAVYNQSAITAGQGPFGAAIWVLSPKIRREVAMLGFGMLRPRRLRAGPLSTVDLPSFIQIVRAAYSYYAVLGNNKQD